MAHTSVKIKLPNQEDSTSKLWDKNLFKHRHLKEDEYDNGFFVSATGGIYHADYESGPLSPSGTIYAYNAYQNYWFQVRKKPDGTMFPESLRFKSVYTSDAHNMIRNMAKIFKWRHHQVALDPYDQLHEELNAGPTWYDTDDDEGDD